MVVFDSVYKISLYVKEILTPMGRAGCPSGRAGCTGVALEAQGSRRMHRGHAGCTGVAPDAQESRRKQGGSRRTLGTEFID